MNGGSELTIFGSPRSRTMRVLWAAEELGLHYRHVPYEYDDPALKSREFLSLNPSGAVPTLVDGAVVVAESLAINLYLAKTYGQTDACRLYPSDAAGEAKVLQWSFFAQGHLEPWVQKDALLRPLLRAIGNLADGMIERSLSVLETALSSSEWLVGDSFSVADLNVAGVLSPSRSEALDLSDHPAVAGWLMRSYSRPAALTVRRRFA